MSTNRLGRVYFLRWGPALLWMAVIFAFSATSDPYRLLPSGGEERCLTFRCQDEAVGRVGHVLEYALLMALVCRGVLWRREVRWGGVLASAGLAATYALLDETHQLFVPGRSFQLEDLGRDAAGIMLGAGAFALAKRARTRAAGEEQEGG
jgi:VanZ family protein